MAGLLSSSAAQAQTFTGTASCGGSECHTKRGEIDWLQTKEKGGKEHRESLRRMRAARENSEKYAKAVNLASFEDPKGMCVKCHATYVTKAQTLEGVGCEGCHGPAGGYREFHSQNPKEYKGAVQRGMRDLQRAPSTWVGVCRDCHVLDAKEYEPLLDAGHKDNARWKVETKFEGVSAHWKNTPTYTAALIAAALKGPVAVPAGPPPPVATEPAPTPSAPAAPPPDTPPAARGGATPTAPGPPPAPREAPRPGPSTPAVVAPSRTPDPGVSVTASPAPPATALSPLALSLPPPVSRTGLLGALQDRLAGLLASMLRGNAAPDPPLPPIELARELTGPDAELLRLQTEALALAVEALNLRATAARPTPPK